MIHVRWGFQSLDTAPAEKSRFFYGGTRINRMDLSAFGPGPDQSLALIHARQQLAMMIIIPG
jgi:hypothetical protein